MSIRPSALASLFCACIASLFWTAPAYADVCLQARPNWHAEHGPVTMFGEIGYLVFSPGGIMVLILAVLAMRFRQFWFSIVIALGAFALAGLNYYTWQNPIGIDAEARLQGCIGNPSLAIAIFTLLGAATLIRQFVGGGKTS